MKAHLELQQFGTPLISDGLDALGLSPRTLSPELKLLSAPAEGRFCGRVKTFLWRARGPEEPLSPPPLDKTIALVQRLEAFVEPGDVLLFGFDGPVPPFGPLGGLYATLYRQLGAVGVVSDAYVRDIDEIRALGLGVVARGTSPLNARGRISLLSLDAPIRVGGVEARTADVLVADADGAIIVPKEETESSRLLEWLRRTAEAEKKTTAALQAGERLSSAYARYGAL